MSLKIFISHVDLNYETSSQILYLSILVKILLVFLPHDLYNLKGSVESVIHLFLHER